jgi:hypothetical protein
MRCRDTFPLSIVIGCGAATRASRFGPARFPAPPSRDVAPAATTAPLGAISKRHPEIPDLWVALNDDFRPAASHIRRGPGKADRLSSRIWTQAQRKQIGETEGSLDV